MPEHWLIWAIVLLAVLFDYINGFHDTANAIATCVSTRAITPRHAIMMAACLNFAGAMISTGVAKTLAAIWSSIRLKSVWKSSSPPSSARLSGMSSPGITAFRAVRLIPSSAASSEPSVSASDRQLSIWAASANHPVFDLVACRRLDYGLFRHDRHPLDCPQVFTIGPEPAVPQDAALVGQLDGFSHGSNDAQKAMGSSPWLSCLAVILKPWNPDLGQDGLRHVDGPGDVGRRLAHHLHDGDENLQDGIDQRFCSGLELVYRHLYGDFPPPARQYDPRRIGLHHGHRFSRTRPRRPLGRRPQYARRLGRHHPHQCPYVGNHFQNYRFSLRLYLRFSV